MKLNGKEFPKELMVLALLCDTPEELMKLAENNNLELTREQAEAYISDLDAVDLDTVQMNRIANGSMCWLDYKLRDEIDESSDVDD